MRDESWVKLWRTLRKDPIWLKDHTLFTFFFRYILLEADLDGTRAFTYSEAGEAR